MNPGAVFRVVALFNALRFPLINLPGSLGGLMSGMVSARRVQSFLVADEINPSRHQIGDHPAPVPASNAAAAPVDGSAVLPSPQRRLQISEFEPMDNSYFIRHGTFKFQATQPTPALSDITMKIPKGSLIGVVGVVSVAGYTARVYCL